MSIDEIERAKYWETEYYKMREDWNTLLLHEVETAKQQSYAKGVKDGKKEIISAIQKFIEFRTGSGVQSINIYEDGISRPATPNEAANVMLNGILDHLQEYIDKLKEQQ